MRKIIVFNLVTLDGYFAGEDGNIDWHMVDDEFNDFAVEQTGTFGGIIFGRTTYQIFEEFWPALARTGKFPGSEEPASPEDVQVGKFIDDVEKYVFSKSLKDVAWERTTLYHDIDPDDVMKLKKQDGKDIFILGSGQIVQQMANLELIDEYRLLVNPVLLGKGKLLFEGVKPQHLRLLSTRTFGNGNVLMTYTAEYK
jgi:dihydrofolate reductase